MQCFYTFFRKTTISIAALSVLLSPSTFAFGSKTEWTSGYAQGTSEYTVLGTGQSALYFACSPDSAAFVQFTDQQGNQYSSIGLEGKSIAFYAVIDGEEYILNDVQSDAGASNFSVAWDALRKGKKLVIELKDSEKILSKTSFTLKGAKSTLPAFKDSECKIGFDIP